MSSRAAPPGDRCPPARASWPDGRRGRARPEHVRPRARPGRGAGAAGEPVLVHARPEEHRELRELAGDRSSAARFVSGAPRADAAGPADGSFLRHGPAASPPATWPIAGIGRALAARPPRSDLLGRRGADASTDLSADRQILGVSPGPAAGRRAPPDPGPAQPRDPGGSGLHARGGRPRRRRAHAGWTGRAAVAIAMALALVLDTADGRLARLQGTSSAFGRWLDQFLDELADVALHAAIAWWAYCRDGQPLWLVVGILYASGKYLFLVQSTLGDELERRSSTPGPNSRSAGIRIGRSPRAASPASCIWSATPTFAGISGSFWRPSAGWTLRWWHMRCISRYGPWPVRSGRGLAMPEPRISVLVVAKDEAHNLADCLAAASVGRRARRRGGSAPAATPPLEIARRVADVVAVRAFDDFASQRNAALALASGDWVLSVDADERVTPALAAEIRRVIADPDAPYQGYRVPIRSEILGRRFGFSGTQHDLPLRLFRRDSGRWVGLVHETVELHGAVGAVEMTCDTGRSPPCGSSSRRSMITRRWRREGWPLARRAYRTTDLALRPFWTFFKLYVLKQGFRDGVEGFMFCLFSGVSAAVRAWKHRELTLAGRTP